MELRIVIMGPPGSGKGTRAQILGEMHSVPVITTGDILREVVASGSRIGRIAESYMNKGDLVPDEVVNKVVEDRLSRPDTRGGFILDGYPRSLSQAEALDRILQDQCVSLDYVLYVDLDDESIINRLSNRRICSNCDEIYNLKTKPPEEPGICDVCGSKLIQRRDDKPEVIKNRLDVYREKTKPLLVRYKKRNLVKKTSGEIELDEIPKALRELLEG